jgi:hypothetical protein
MDNVTDNISDNVKDVVAEDSANEFFEIQEKMQQDMINGFSLINMADIVPEEVDWLWYPYIPYGKITLLQGDPGCGKTTFILALAASLTTGTGIPGDSTERSPVNVIYQTAEDGLADTIKPRLLSYGANCSLIDVIEDNASTLTLDDERIEKAIKTTNAKLFVLDPLQAFLGAKVDMHRANEVRPVFTRLAGIVARTNCACVIIGHLNKSSGKGIYRSLGSVDIVAAARSVLLLGRDPNDPAIRAVIPIKSSLAPEGKAMAFSVGSVEKNGFSWIGESELTVKDLLSDEQDNTRVIQRAVNLVREHCSSGPILSTELEEIAGQNGISKSTLKRARFILKTRSVKKNDQWYVALEDT